MPKFYKQNKKRIDPRYFMDEKIEEAVIEPGLTKAGEWPEDKTNAAMMSRAAAAAERGQRVAAGEEELPPWQGDGVPDVQLDLLSSQDLEELKGIHKHLSTVAGGGNRGERFAEIMSKLGIPGFTTSSPESENQPVEPDPGADFRKWKRNIAPPDPHDDPRWHEGD